MVESYSERLAKLREEKLAKGGNVLPFAPPQTAPMPVFKPEDVPDVLGNRSDEDRELDRIIDSIDVVSAYNKWCGKSTPKVGGKTESIMISCPKPDHPDKDPSAWLNTDKNTWFCGGCQEGGDSYDIAAYSFGYPVPGYKDGQTFHKLREQMAESFGYHIKKVTGGTVIYREEESSAQPETETKAVEPEVDPDGGIVDDSNVLQMYADDAGEDELVIYPTIDWRNIVTPDTFLWEYMEACTNDDSPEEYHFWHGMLAIGHAVGRKVTLDDHRPVYGNLMVCLLGATGTGKSRSRGWLDTVTKAVMPYKENGIETSGVKLVPTPGSGEYLVSAFCYEGRDPSNPKMSLGYKPVNGIVDFDEMASLLTRANRQGSTLKTTLMGFADARNQVSIGSLTHGETTAIEPFCSITASTQPKAVRTVLNRQDSGSGFLNRWVFAGGPAKEREVIGGSHSSTVINLDRAIEQLKTVYGYGGFVRSLRLDEQALMLLTHFYKTKLFPVQTKDDTDLLKRLDLLFKKIILLFAINEKLDVIPERIVKAAIKLFEYVVECYAILNSNIGITQSSEVGNALLLAIQRHQSKTGRGASIRDIQRYVHRKNYSNDQIKKALETMVALDMVELEKKAQGGHIGRPVVRYVAVGE